jgi:hypothetical protein
MSSVRILFGLSYPAFGRGLVQQCIKIIDESVVNSWVIVRFNFLVT